MKRLHRLRPLLRIAWRDARGHRGRSLLVLAMVALPVAALTAGLTAYTALTPTTDELAADVLGHGDVTLVGDPVALRRAAADLPDGATVTVRTTVTARTVAGGAQHTVAVDDVAPDDAVLAPRYEMLDGRAPQRPGEAAVTPAVLADLDAGIGERIGLDEPALHLTVTGTVRRPERLAEPAALVAPGTLDDVPGAVVSAVFVDLPAGVDPADLVLDEAVTSVTRTDLTGADEETSTAFGSMFGLAALGLAETGLVIAAAFVVGTQRRLRRAGLVAAAGGEPRDNRAVVLSEGVVLGLLGGIAGVGLGLLAVAALSSRLDDIAGRVTSDTAPPPGVLVGAIALGVVTATLAVLGQARLAGRVGVIDALAGRLPDPAPPGRVARWGGIVGLAGAGVIAAGAGLGEEGIQVLGVGVMVVGALMAVPLLVAITGRAATSLPLPLRLAARDTARHGRRAGAAVAAAALALALPITVATIMRAEDTRNRAEPPLATDHVLVSGGNRASMADAPAVDAAVRAAVDVEAAAPMLPAQLPDDGGPATVFAGPAGGTAGAAQLGTLTVGGPELLRALHAESAIDDLQAGAAVIIGGDGPAAGVVHVAAAAGGEVPAVELRTVTTDGPGFPALARVVVSPERAAELELTVSPVGALLYRASAPIALATLDEIRAGIATLEDVWVLGAEDTLGGTASLERLLLAIAVPVALATLGVSTAMVVAESRRDQAVLAAVGAAPGTRRRVIGSAALLLGLLAAVIAVPAGFVPVTLVLQLTDPTYPAVVPWTAMAGVFAAALLAGLGGLLLSREPPAASLLRPLS